jgi:hypothetical protein
MFGRLLARSATYRSLAFRFEFGNFFLGSWSKPKRTVRVHVTVSAIGPFRKVSYPGSAKRFGQSRASMLRKHST